MNSHWLGDYGEMILAVFWIGQSSYVLQSCIIKLVLWKLCHNWAVFCVCFWTENCQNSRKKSRIDEWNGKENLARIDRSYRRQKNCTFQLLELIVLILNNLVTIPCVLGNWTGGQYSRGSVGGICNLLSSLPDLPSLHLPFAAPRISFQMNLCFSVSSLPC